MQRCLAGDPAVAAADHVGVDAGRGGPPGRAAARADPCASGARGRPHPRAGRGPADLDAEVAVHGMRLPLGVLLVVRAFELWVHENDIRRAAGLPPSVPDPPMLRPDDRGRGAAAAVRRRPDRRCTSR